MKEKKHVKIPLKVKRAFLLIVFIGLTVFSVYASFRWLLKSVSAKSVDFTLYVGIVLRLVSILFIFTVKMRFERIIKIVFASLLALHLLELLFGARPEAALEKAVWYAAGLLAAAALVFALVKRDNGSFVAASSVLLAASVLRALSPLIAGSDSASLVSSLVQMPLFYAALLLLVLFNRVLFAHAHESDPRGEGEEGVPTRKEEEYADAVRLLQQQLEDGRISPVEYRTRRAAAEAAFGIRTEAPERKPREESAGRLMLKKQLEEGALSPEEYEELLYSLPDPRRGMRPSDEDGERDDPLPTLDEFRAMDPREAMITLIRQLDGGGITAEEYESLFSALFA